jgi:hypothetical protein
MTERTYTLKPVESSGHQVGLQLAFYTDRVPFCKLEIPSGMHGEVSIETLRMFYTFIKTVLPPEYL